MADIYLRIPLSRSVQRWFSASSVRQRYSEPKNSLKICCAGSRDKVTGRTVTKSQYRLSFSEGLVTVPLGRAVEARSWRPKDVFKKTFLPLNYPQSTHPSFSRYCWWNALHNVAGTMAGTLATQALLQGLQFSAPATNGVAATVNWVIKDGFGLFGGVIFAAFASANFDSQPKRYRWLAGLALEGAMLLEILTPLVTPLWSPGFLLLASLSNVGKNMAWLAISATRASFHQSFALQGNLGDITAKAGAQSVAASFVGTILGIGLNWFVTLTPENLVAMWLPFAVLHTWSLYKSSASVCTRTLNKERFQLACEITTSDIGPVKLKVRSPEEVAGGESFARSYSLGEVVKTHFSIQHFKSDSDNLLRSLNWCIDHELPYYLHPAVNGTPSGDATVAVWILRDSSAHTQIYAYLHALILQRVVSSSKETDVTVYLEQSLSLLQNLGQATVIDELKSKGWNLDVNYIFNSNDHVKVER